MRRIVMLSLVAIAAIVGTSMVAESLAAPRRSGEYESEMRGVRSRILLRTRITAGEYESEMRGMSRDKN